MIPLDELTEAVISSMRRSTLEEVVLAILQENGELKAERDRLQGDLYSIITAVDGARCCLSNDKITGAEASGASPCWADSDETNKQGKIK
jgi:hypothetical protein